MDRGNSRREPRVFEGDRTALKRRDDRRGRRESPIAGAAAAAARACAMARHPHTARGRSGTCASEAACALAGRAVAPFLPAARVPPSARACAHGDGAPGRKGDPPLDPNQRISEVRGFVFFRCSWAIPRLLNSDAKGGIERRGHPVSKSQENLDFPPDDRQTPARREARNHRGEVRPAA